jgi:hypothetical protein
MPLKAGALLAGIARGMENPIGLGPENPSYRIYKYNM